MLSKSGPFLRPDPSRVLLRAFPLGETRARRLHDRVAAMDEETVHTELHRVLGEFAGRHRDLPGRFTERGEATRARLGETGRVSPERVRLLGAFFSMEYSLECAALFNPSIVPHPDGRRDRYVLSLRAVGEGHISSVLFAEVLLDGEGRARVEPASPWVTCPEPEFEAEEGGPYSVRFPAEWPLPERALFPCTPEASKGIEDARFVRFHEEDGSTRYYGTFTAYDGHRISPQLIETGDFSRFRITPLEGAAARDKGMALFPRKIDGDFWMLGRQDGESVTWMRSGDPRRWEEAETLLEPLHPWEGVQLGNCGSPLETSEGWLVLTHGVGPVRRYTLGAALLDLRDPSKVLARSREPILWAEGEEREGYVPNVVYTCGAVIHEGTLVVPFAVSDQACAFARAPLAEVLASLH